MTTAAYNNTVLDDTDANFRIWGKAISDAMTAVGVPKTTDTGQIDWLTVTHPLSAAVSMGYEIRYFNDALNATRPLVVKIEYGSGSNTINSAIYITIGHGSDGAGNITGIIYARTMFQLNNNGLTASADHMQYSDGSCWALITGWTGGMSAGLTIDRSRDINGAITGDGIVINSMPYSASAWTEFVSDYNGLPNWSIIGVSHLLPRPMTSNISLSDGVDIHVAEQVMAGPQNRWYSKLKLAYANADIVAGATFTATIFGAVHTFRATGLQYFGARLGTSNASQDRYSCLAICWE